MTVYYTQVFTGGTLEGLTYQGTIGFAEEQNALAWLDVAESGVETPFGGSPYRVIESQIVIAAQG